MPEERRSTDEEIPALKVATDVLRLALVALDLALTEHPKDTYLQGQAREHVWKSYWELREAAGDRPTGADQKLKEQEERCERLTVELAQCYRLTGAEPAGVDSMDARYAVKEVQRLRRELGDLSDTIFDTFDTETAERIFLAAEARTALQHSPEDEGGG